MYGVFKILTQILTQEKVNDPFTGLRIFTRHFVESINISSTGFEVETELNLQAAFLNYRFFEFPTVYKSRCIGSTSKLKTIQDGARILNKMSYWFRILFPRKLGIILVAIFFTLGAALCTRVVYEFFITGAVSLIPSAIFGVGSIAIGAILMNLFLVLSALSRIQQQNALYNAAKWRRRGR